MNEKTAEQMFDESMKTVEFHTHMSSFNTALGHLTNMVTLILLLCAPAILKIAYMAAWG